MHVRVVLLLIFASLGTCLKSYQDRIPNGRNVLDPCDPSVTWPAVGHDLRYPPNQGSFHINHHNTRFGLDFAAAGHRWTETLCRQDSDGDSRTNGEELGDPFCQWTVGDIPSHKVSGHPGFNEETYCRHLDG
ncbi:temptin-like [Gigantopelta aegis]|uniref:temptin-like n=1 Tax=Gigantopelta aegis TaxID=1735272 RepID=UPI001B887B2C|nr:temptin-like [Gigantopelta aegis]